MAIKVPNLPYEELRRRADKFLSDHHSKGTLPVPIEHIIESQFKMWGGREMKRILKRKLPRSLSLNWTVIAGRRARPNLKAPMPKVQALAEARRWLRDLSRTEVLGRLKELGIAANEQHLQDDRPFEHPYFWAPFIMVGDPETTLKP